MVGEGLNDANDFDAFRGLISPSGVFGRPANTEEVKFCGTTVGAARRETDGIGGS